MRLPQLFLALAVLASAAPAVQSAPKSPYIAELNRQCPTRELQDLSAGDLELIMEGFEGRLTPAQRHKVEDAVGYQCARIEAGLTCGNNASLDTFRRLGLLRRFVGEACAAGWTCHGFADCVQAKP
jgi:hypothetical protein